MKTIKEQVCIPAGCVPPAGWPYLSEVCHLWYYLCWGEVWHLWWGGSACHGIVGRPTSPSLNRITDTCGNITFPQLCLRAVPNIIGFVFRFCSVWMGLKSFSKFHDEIRPSGCLFQVQKIFSNGHVFIAAIIHSYPWYVILLQQFVKQTLASYQQEIPHCILPNTDYKSLGNSFENFTVNIDVCYKKNAFQ